MQPAERVCYGIGVLHSGCMRFTFARELKTPTMNVLRWIAFLPVTYVLTNVAYLAVGWASVKFPWWGMLVLFVIAVVPIGMAGALSVAVSPNRKIGGYLFVGLLVLGELFKIREFVADWPGHLIFWRVVADAVMIHGALSIAVVPKEMKILG